MTVVIVKPGYAPYEAEINGLDEMQEVVGGMIQAIYPFEDRAAVVCNKNEFHCAEILIGATGNTPITMKIQPKAVGNSGQEKGRNDPPGRE